MISAADVWSIVKLRLYLADDVHKPLADSYIAEIEQRILHYINHRSMPTGLLYTWAAMAAAALSADQGELLHPPPEQVELQEVKVGDTTVKTSLAKPIAVPQPNLQIVDKIMFDYRVDLHHYRKMRWGR
ncbi:hypothetical protein D3C74_182890 [compost metagenome]